MIIVVQRESVNRKSTYNKTFSFFIIEKQSSVSGKSSTFTLRRYDNMGGLPLGRDKSSVPISYLAAILVGAKDSILPNSLSDILCLCY